MKSSYVILATEEWYNAVLNQLPSHVQEIVESKSEKVYKFGKNLVEISDYNDSYYEDEDMYFSEFEKLLFNDYDNVYVKTFDFVD